MKKIWLASFIFLIGGFMFFTIYNEFIILRWPLNLEESAYSNKKISKKKMQVFWWANDKWNYEETEIIFHSNLQKSAYEVLTAWISILDENNIINKKINIESVMLDPTNSILYISFEKSPFSKQSSIFEKLKIIESILKTLKSANLDLQKTIFFVNHKPIQDPHLDFAKAFII